ncbi:MAG: discoidin domain-containing protein, partial [Patescibacteria group bacterium]
ILPLMFFFFAQNPLRKKIKFPLLIFGVGIIYFAFRAVFLSSGPYISTSKGMSVDIFYNFAFLPIKTVSQTLLPPSQIIKISYSLAPLFPQKITGERGTTTFDLFVQSKILPVLDLIIFILVIVVLWMLWRRGGAKSIKLALFAFIFVIINSIVYAVSPEKNGLISIIDSRNLYFPSIGTFIFVAYLASFLMGNNFKKAFLLLLPLLALNAFWLNRELASLAEIGSLRRNILFHIKSEYPTLPDKTVFYIESDTSYYGLAEHERILPFQSGFGQTLLVWYHEGENFPKELYQNKFLWDITDQGYRGVDNKGFGYFRSFDELIKGVLENRIDPASVFAFSYKSDEKKIIDITEQTRGEMAGLAASKFELNLSAESSVNFSHNPAHGFLALDGKRDTYWSSEVPYAIKPQYFDIDFGKEVKIAQIRIDSYDNKDQNQVGYAVFLSDNGKDWVEIFRTLRRTPRQDGFVDIYLPKNQSRFLRVEQIGEHEYAPWVIHEFKVYSAL